MKKNLKKLFAVMMVALLGMTTMVSAAELTVDNTKNLTTDTNSHYVTNQGTITISNVNAGDKLKAYKILDVYYNATTNVVSYDFTTDFKAFLAQSTTHSALTITEYMALTSGSTETGSTRTESTLDALASEYAAYIKTNTVTGTEMTTTGTNATATVDAGSYLVLPTSTARVYAVMVGNVTPVANGENWDIQNATIVAKVSEAGITKKAGDKIDTSYEIGEEIPFQLTMTVPQYPTNAVNRKYEVTDTMSTGLTFVGLNTISVKDGATALTTNAETSTITNADGEKVADIKVEGQTITITFDVTKVNSTTLTIDYKAKLNDDAVIGGVNSNNASLEYSNDPYGAGTNTTSGSGQVTIKTYTLTIIKHEKDKPTTTLPGATFEVYRDSALTDRHSTVTTGTDGTISIKGLKEGTYYLKETKSPAGYSLNKDATPVSITDTDATEGVVTARISNSPVGALPITGGMGTIVFTVSGAILMIGAIWFIFVYKKKNNNQEA